MSDETLQLAGLINDSITDGPGLRLAVFVQGCPRHCEGCHNPKAQPFEGGIAVTVDVIIAKIKRNPILSGVTFTGGEPFSQAKGLIALAKEIRKIKGLDLAVYTGYTFEEILENEAFLELARHVDIIVDGPFIIAQKDLSLKFKGSANQRIIDVKESLKQNKAVLTTSDRWI